MRTIALLLLISSVGHAAPALSWSAYFGGAGGDRSSNPAIDQDGNIWITGRAGGNHPTTPDAFQPQPGGGTCGIPDPRIPIQYPCGDVFITKLDPTGSKILYSTYLGGSGEDYGRQIAADRAGNIYVLGTSQSTDFPAVPGTIGTGSLNNFLLKMTTAGKPVWLLRLPTDTVAFAVDATGSVYLSGTSSNDAFVSKVGPDGLTPIWTYRFGGSDVDSATLLCVDRSSAVYVTGITRSTDFPVTAGALESTLSPYIMFAAKVKADGSGLAYATHFSGGITALGCDDNGSAYLAGVAVAGFRTTPGAAQTTFRDDGTSLPGDAFLAKLNATGTGLVYATYIGGAKYEIATGVAVDAAGIATVAGLTNSSNFPVAAPVQGSIHGNADAFVTRVSPDGSSFLYSTFLGGNTGDLATGVAVDGAGNAIIRGCSGGDTCLLAPNSITGADPLGAPATDNAFSSAPGTRGIFVASVAPNAPAVPRLYQNSLANLGSGLTAPAVPGGTIQIFGSGLGPSTPATLQIGADGRVSSTLAGVRLLFDGIPAPLLMVSANEIRAVVPFGIAGQQKTQVTLTSAGTATNPIAAAVSDADPALLSADGVQAAALNQDGSVNSPANPAQRGGIVVLYALATGQTAPPGIDGSLVGAPLPTSVLPIAVTIGGLVTDVQYAGPAPGLIAGVTQINVVLPAGLPAGAVQPVLTVGSHRSQPGPVISLR